MDWKASWIWHPETENTNNFYLFARRAFELASVPPAGTLFITANNIYKLFVNGVCVGTGPNPSDPSRYYYDVYDVASHLRPGANAVSVIAYSYGPGRKDVNRQNWGRGGLLVELRESRDGETILATDEDWKVLQAPCWGQDAQICGIHYGDYQEHYDSREEIEGWMEPGFDDSAWKTPQVIGRPPVEPWTRLVEREIPFLNGETVHPVNAHVETASVAYGWRDDWEIYHEARLAAAARLPSAPKDKHVEIYRTREDFTPSIVLDFGRLVTGTPHIAVADSQGGVIEVLYGESLSMTRVDRFVLKGGPQVLAPFNRRTCRYMKLQFPETPAKILLDEVRLEMNTYPVDPDAAAFACSDDRLTRIWDVARYTMRLCMLDHICDCPWRERVLAGGDLYAENLISYYAFGDPRLVRKSLRQRFNIQFDDGGIPPSGVYRGFPLFYPKWTAFDGLALMDYARLTGDLDLARELWGGLEKILAFAEREMDANPYDLVGDVAGRASHEEWVEAKKECFLPVTNLPFQQLAARAAEMARRLDKPNRAAAFGQIASRLAKGIRKHLIDREAGTVKAFRTGKGRCRRPQQFDVGLVAWSDLPFGGEVVDSLFAPDTNKIGSPYHGLFVVEGLYRQKRDDAALDIIREHWGAMLDLYGGTFFEHYSLAWPTEALPRRGDSLCHGFSAGPGYSLPAHVLGVTPTEPGFDRVLIAPSPGDLHWAAGKVPTPHGPVGVEWQQSPHRFRITFDVPEGCVAELHLPPYRGRDRAVLVNGKPSEYAWQDGRQTVELNPGRCTIEQTLK